MARNEDWVVYIWMVLLEKFSSKLVGASLLCVAFLTIGLSCNVVKNHSANPREVELSGVLMLVFPSEPSSREKGIELLYRGNQEFISEDGKKYSFGDLNAIEIYNQYCHRKQIPNASEARLWDGALLNSLEIYERDMIIHSPHIYYKDNDVVIALHINAKGLILKRFCKEYVEAIEEDDFVCELRTIVGKEVSRFFATDLLEARFLNSSEIVKLGLINYGDTQFTYHICG